MGAAWRLANPLYQSQQMRRVRYDVDVDEFSRLYELNDGRCHLCCDELRADRSTVIDHCHATGRIRGLLCNRCNTGLGRLGDNEAGLLRALAYVRGQASGTQA